MGKFLNRTTKEYRPRGNTPDFPTSEWIHNPDLSAVAGQPNKYWVINGDSVSLADQAARDAIDAAELAEGRLIAARELDDSEAVLRAFMLLVLDQINTLRAQHGLSQFTAAQMRNAIVNRLGD